VAPEVLASASGILAASAMTIGGHRGYATSPDPLSFWCHAVLWHGDPFASIEGRVWSTGFVDADSMRRTQNYSHWEYTGREGHIVWASERGTVGKEMLRCRAVQQRSAGVAGCVTSTTAACSFFWLLLQHKIAVMTLQGLPLTVLSMCGTGWA
jgi:hypothetical protein